jgi:uncharacterized protein YcnI
MASPRILSRLLRTGVTVAAVGVVGLVSSPGAWAAAPADVTITPTKADQGGATNLTFQVPDDRGSVYTTKVVVQLPANAPIGEVDPLSVANWAPQLTYRNLASPVPGIHSGATTTVATAVTWTRVGAPKTPGQTNQLFLSMGPLPKVAQLAFDVTQTYSDKTVKHYAAAPAGNGPVLTLTPVGASGSAAGSGMSGMAGMPGMGTVVVPTGTPAAGVPGTGDSGGSAGAGLFGAFGAGLTGGVLIAALAGGWMLTRNRREGRPSQPVDADRPAEPAEPATEPVAAEQDSEEKVGVK